MKDDKINELRDLRNELIELNGMDLSEKIKKRINRFYEHQFDCVLHSYCQHEIIKVNSDKEKGFVMHMGCTCMMCGKRNLVKNPTEWVPGVDYDYHSTRNSIIVINSDIHSKDVSSKEYRKIVNKHLLLPTYNKDEVINEFMDVLEKKGTVKILQYNKKEK
jgi:hypothetical protein